MDNHHLFKSISCHVVENAVNIRHTHGYGPFLVFGPMRVKFTPPSSRVIFDAQPRWSVMKEHIHHLLEQTVANPQVGRRPARGPGSPRASRPMQGEGSRRPGHQPGHAVGQTGPQESPVSWPAIIEHLPASDLIAKVEIAGPGFINFFFDPSWLAGQVEAMVTSANANVKLPAPQTVVVDYSAPNVAKEMAVHHIRSTVLGDVAAAPSIPGPKVVRANHIGDWGTQFGMLIAYLEKMANEHASDMDCKDLEAFYTQAKRHYDEDEAFAERARNYVVKLQGGDEYCRTMWKKLVDMTMEQNQRNYDRLNISLSNKGHHGRVHVQRHAAADRCRPESQGAGGRERRPPWSSWTSSRTGMASPWASSSRRATAVSSTPPPTSPAPNTVTRTWAPTGSCASSTPVSTST